MQAIDLLKKDHERVNGLFERFDALDADAFEEREETLSEINRELTVHTDIEEKVFYPAFRQKASSQEDIDMLEHSLAEHAQVKEMLAEMIEMDADDPALDEQMITLVQMVQEHVEDEESEGGMFDRASELFSREEMNQLGKKMEEQKSRSEEDLAA